jgi:hypothetical protein
MTVDTGARTVAAMTGEGAGRGASTGCGARRFDCRFGGGVVAGESLACPRRWRTASAIRCASLENHFELARSAAAAAEPSGVSCASSDDAAYNVATVAVATAARDNALRARRFIWRNPDGGALPPAGC